MTICRRLLTDNQYIEFQQWLKTNPQLPDGCKSYYKAFMKERGIVIIK